MKKILVINPGATSTKICVFEDDQEVMRVGIDHDAAEIAKYPHVVDQAPFRKEAILKTIEEKGYKLLDFGKLRIKKQGARTVRNPQTGATIKKPACKVAKFRLAKAAKDALVPPKAAKK